MLRFLEQWFNRLLALFRNGSKQRELDMELQAHIELMTQDYIRSGMSPEDARKAASKHFGATEKFKEECRDSWGTRVVMDLIRDIRYSARSLWKSKGFAFTVIATLALCIGANTTIFSVLYELVLKPLPFQDHERIVKIYNIPKGGQRSDFSNASWSQYNHLNEQADLFEGFVLARPLSRTVDGVQRDVSGVTSDFFDLLGVRPLLGRFFAPEEVHPGPGNVAILTETTWKNDFSSDPNVVGKTLQIFNEVPYVIVGVAPRSIETLYPAASFFIPFKLIPSSLNPRYRTMPRSDLWAKLKPDVSREQGRLHLEAVERRAIEEYHPQYMNVWEMNPRHFEVDPPHPLASSLVILQGGTLILFIVGGINVLNLLLSRSARRGAELSVRHSFGAGKAVLGRMMLIESLLLAMFGFVLGCILAWGGLFVFNFFFITLFPKSEEITLGFTVFIWSLVMAGAIAFLAGLLPFTALWGSGRIRKTDKSSRSSSTDRRGRFLSNGLVVTQVAITITLVIGAGLVIRSFGNILSVDPGFDAAHVIKGRVVINRVYPDRRDWLDARNRILYAMRQIPGVENVAFDLDRVTVGQGVNHDRFSIRGGSANGEEQPHALKVNVNSEYFKTMGIEILEGRTFYSGLDEFDTSYIVDESFANRYLEGGVTLGAEVHVEDPPLNDEDWKKIIGIARRANFQGLESRDGLPVVYMDGEHRPQWGFTILLRTERESESVVRDMQSKLREINSQLILQQATSLDKPLTKLHMDRQGVALLAGVFACLALFLSAVGIYGVLSYDVKQRQREIGTRTAVGAKKSNVLMMVIRQGIWKTTIGLGLGLLASLHLTRFLENQLFDMAALDFQTYFIAILVLLLIAFIASYLPARRAVKVEPIEVLRAE